MIEKVSCVGFVVKNTIVDLTLHNLNVFDLLPTRKDLALDNPTPVQLVCDDLKLLVFNVYSPEASKKKIIKTDKSNSSSSSSAEEEETKKNEEEENKGKFNRNYKSILVPNLRYWQSEESGAFELLFESNERFNISHVLVKTPRFTKYPLRRVLFYAFETDPRIKKPKKDDDSSGDELAGVYQSSKVIWPPRAPPGKPVPFAYIEIPANKYYVEQKLPVNIQGRFIKARFLDGWEKERGNGPGPLKNLGRSGHEKISIEFIGFVGPADPGEIIRDVGAKFGIIH